MLDRLITSKSFPRDLALDVGGKGLARRFRRIIHLVDSSTIALIASCIDWAQHRRRKAAAKLHVRLDLHSLLPRFVLVESAKAADSIRAAEVCAGVKPCEIVIRPTNAILASAIRLFAENRRTTGVSTIASTWLDFNSRKRNGARGAELSKFWRTRQFGYTWLAKVLPN